MSETNEEVTDQTSLDDLLNGAKSEDPPAEEDPPKIEAKAEEDKDKTPEPGEKDKKDEGVAAEPAEDLEKQFKAFKTMALEDRKKRQVAEEALAAVREAKPAKPPVSIFDDENAYNQQVVGYIDNKVRNAVSGISELHARKNHSDMQEMIDKYNELAPNNPHMVQAVNASQDPYETVHEVVKQHEDFAAMQNMDATKEQMRQEIREEEREKLLKEIKAGNELDESIPPSLASQNSKGTLSGPEWAGETPLDNVVGPKAAQS